MYMSEFCFHVLTAINRVYAVARHATDYRIVPSRFPNPVAGLECVTLPWRLLQEA